MSGEDTATRIVVTVLVLVLVCGCPGLCAGLWVRIARWCQRVGVLDCGLVERAQRVPFVDARETNPDSTVKRNTDAKRGHPRSTHPQTHHRAFLLNREVPRRRRVGATISPRCPIVDLSIPGLYQCVLRCKRRAFLRWQDQYTGQSVEQRSDWVQQRVHAVARWLSVGVYTFALMSSQLHSFLQVDPGAIAICVRDEVARLAWSRWARLALP